MPTVPLITYHCRKCPDRPEAMLGTPLRQHGGHLKGLHCAVCDTITDDQDTLDRLAEWAEREHKRNPGIANRVLGFADCPFEVHLPPPETALLLSGAAEMGEGRRQAVGRCGGGPGGDRTHDPAIMSRLL